MTSVQHHARWSVAHRACYVVVTDVTAETHAQRLRDTHAAITMVLAEGLPAADAKQRQLQLRSLAQKFIGHQFWDPNNSRYELRRLERPLCTYQDEDAGILDGALYTLANGTNPEILLFVHDDQTLAAIAFEPDDLRKDPKQLRLPIATVHPHGTKTFRMRLPQRVGHGIHPLPLALPVDVP